MSNEISEEAKKSLADVARRKAFERLEKDGAHSTAAMQRRVRALAQERNIPAADFHKLMYKRPSTPACMEFCEKHKVSYDWLLAGDLKGLQRMTIERKLCNQAVPIVDRFMQKYRNLSPVEQAIIDETVDRLLEQQK
jgi:hypothetical protein